jgi:hypothetical protein
MWFPLEPPIAGEGRAIDFAESSARLKASAEEMSGLGAPLRTATAAMELATSVTEPAITFLTFAKLSIPDRLIITTSTSSPASIRFTI